MNHICKYCGKEYTKGKSLGGHVITCKFNPKREETIKKMNKSKRGVPLSEKHKRKVSIGRTKYLKEHPDQVPYRLNHSSKMSYPEKIFQDKLIERKINGWIYNYPQGIYQYDFAFIELGIDVEIDGSTHNTEKVKKIDKKRDEFTKSIGWRVFRIPAKNIKDDSDKVIDEFEKFIHSTETFRKMNKFIHIKSKSEEKRNKAKDNKKEKEIKKKQFIQKRLNDLKDIDLNQRGSIGKLTKLWNISHTSVRRFLNKYYEKDYSKF